MLGMSGMNGQMSWPNKAPLSSSPNPTTNQLQPPLTPIPLCHVNTLHWKLKNQPKRDLNPGPLITNWFAMCFMMPLKLASH